VIERKRKRERERERERERGKKMFFLLLFVFLVSLVCVLVRAQLPFVRGEEGPPPRLFLFLLWVFREGLRGKGNSIERKRGLISKGCLRSIGVQNFLIGKGTTEIFTNGLLDLQKECRIENLPVEPTTIWSIIFDGVAGLTTRMCRFVASDTLLDDD